MKSLNIRIRFPDDVPQGTALLEALGNVVAHVPNIVDQKSFTFNDYTANDVTFTCKWSQVEGDK